MLKTAKISNITTINIPTINSRQKLLATIEKSNLKKDAYLFLILKIRKNLRIFIKFDCSAFSFNPMKYHIGIILNESFALYFNRIDVYCDSMQSQSLHRSIHRTFDF